MAYTTNQYPPLDTEGTGNSFFNVAPCEEEIASAEVVFYFRVVVCVALCGCVSIMGIAANIVNIIVFVRQGIFTGTGSASLLGLAVSDLCCVTSMLWLSVSYAIAVTDPPGLSWVSIDAVRFLALLPHLIFVQITRMVTAYVAFERCVCVVFPFKLKTLFTPKRSITIIASIFVFCVLTFAPHFITHHLQLRMDPVTNTSQLVLVRGPDSSNVIRITYVINSIGFSIGSVVTVIVCTIITVTRVKLSKRWRNSRVSASSSNPQIQQIPDTSISLTERLDGQSRYNVSKIESQSQRINTVPTPRMQREKKLVRIIISISVVFLICYIPDLTYLVGSSIFPRLRYIRGCNNLAVMWYPLGFPMNSINSSINIIVYYRMVPSYQKELDRLLGLRVDNE